MRASLALAAAVTPVVSFGLWTSLPGIADNATFDLAELPPLPALDLSDSIAVSSTAKTTTSVCFKVV